MLGPSQPAPPTHDPGVLRTRSSIRTGWGQGAGQGGIQEACGGGSRYPRRPQALPTLPLPQHVFCPCSPSGMMERYFPRNLLAMVISCQRLQPCLEKT